MSLAMTPIWVICMTHIGMKGQGRVACLCAIERMRTKPIFVSCMISTGQSLATWVKVWRWFSVINDRVKNISILHFLPWVVAPRKARCRAALFTFCADLEPYFCAADVQSLPPVSSPQTPLLQETRPQQPQEGTQQAFRFTLLTLDTYFGRNRLHLKAPTLLGCSSSDDDKLDQPTSKAGAESNQSLTISADSNCAR